LNNVCFVGAGLVPARLSSLSKKTKPRQQTGQPQGIAPTKAMETIDTMDYVDVMDKQTEERT